jgi:hypothetical protein
VASGEHGRAGRGEDELPGHLRVDQQAAGAVQEQDQDLAAAADPANPMAGGAASGDSIWLREDLAVQDAHGQGAPAGDGGAQAGSR